MTQQSEKLIEKFHKAKCMVERQADAVERELNGQCGCQDKCKDECKYQCVKSKSRPQYRKHGL